MNNDDSVEVWNDPELEAKVVAMFMGELSAFEVAEMEEELAKSPELRLFRDRIEETSELILEANEQADDDDQWKLSTEKRTSLLGVFAQQNDQKANTEEIVSVKESEPDAVVSKVEPSTSAVQWRNVISIAACLLVSFIMAAVLFPFKKLIKSNEESVVLRSEDKIVSYSYSAEEDPQAKREAVLARFKQEVREQEDRVEDNRARLYKLSKSLGIPYHGVNSQVASTSQNENQYESADSIYSEIKRERDELDILVKDLSHLSDKRFQTRMLATNRPEAALIREEFDKVSALRQTQQNLVSSGLGADHPRVIAVNKALETTNESLKDSAKLTRIKLSNDLVAMNRRLNKLKKDAESQSGQRMFSAEEHTQFGRVKDEYEREFAILQAIKESSLKESITNGLDESARSSALAQSDRFMTRKRFGPSARRNKSAIDMMGGTSDVMKVEAERGKTALPKEEDIVWADDKVTKPRMISGIEKLPSSPSSSMANSIAASSRSSIAVPMPSLSLDDSGIAFGDGDDFGDGWSDRLPTFTGIASNGKSGKDIHWTRVYKSADYFREGEKLGFRQTEEKPLMEWLVDNDKGRESELLKNRAFNANSTNPQAWGFFISDASKKVAIDGKIALSQQYRRSGKYKEARELLNEAIAGDPGNLFARKELALLDDPVRTSPTLTYEHLKDVGKVRKNLYRGEAYMEQGQFDHALNEYKKTLKIDPYNKAARLGIKKVVAAKKSYNRAVYDKSKEEATLNDAILTEEIAKLQHSIPSKENKEAIALYKSMKKERASNDKRLAVRHRLQNVTLANVEFTEDTTVRQAINFLRLRQRELDTDRSDPTSRGLDFKLLDRRVRSEGVDESGGLAASDSNKIEDIKLGELNLKNVPMDEALRQICQKTGLRYKIGTEGIIVSRATDLDDSGLYTRTFKVPKDFDAILRGYAEEGTVDPFEGKIDLKKASIQELLMRGGIPMPEGAAAVYSKRLGVVTMRNTSHCLDLLEKITGELNEPVKVKPGSLFLEAYEAIETSEKLVVSGKIKQALAKQKYALQVYQKLADQFPQWKTHLVQARLKTTQQMVNTLNERMKIKPAKKNLVLPKELSAAQQTHSTFSLNVSDVSFELARISLLEKAKVPDPSKIRVEEFVNAFDYGDPSASGSKVTCAIEQSAHPMYQQRTLMRIGMKTGAMGRTQPLRLTILLDNSGSMEREDREATVLKAMQALASKLGPQDEVTLLSFARDARLVAQKIKGSETAKLVQYVKSIPSEGGTNLSKAIAQARTIAKKGVSKATTSRIVLITDGAANLGNADPKELSDLIAAMRQEGIAFDACGVGADGLNDELLEALTRKGDGRYYFINKPEDANAEFADKLAGALRPAAKNVKVQVIFNPDRVGNYRLLGFEKHRLKKQDFRNDKVDAAEMAAEEAGNALYQVEAKPDGSGDIGTVFVRFLDVETGKMVERSWAIPYQAQVKSINDSSPSLQLATVAGLLGEKLKFGESARIDLHRLNETVGKLRAHYHNDKKVLDLLRMVERTKR